MEIKDPMENFMSRWTEEFKVSRVSAHTTIINRFEVKSDRRGAILSLFTPALENASLEIAFRSRRLARRFGNKVLGKMMYPTNPVGQQKPCDPIEIVFRFDVESEISNDTFKKLDSHISNETIKKLGLRKATCSLRGS